MGLLTIGAFARASRLSPKALRLYDELGLLRPARTDPDSGYRFYDPAQLERARLVAWLRRLGMPLARIRAVCDLDPEAAAADVAAYWAEVEAETADRRGLAVLLVDHLSGKDTAMAEVAVRDMPARMLLSIQRHLMAEQLEAFTTGLVLRLGDGSVPGLPGIEGAPFLIYYGQVDEDGDGPVEFCRPVPDSEAEGVAARFQDLALRAEPAHREAYVRLTKAQTGQAGSLRALQALERWAAEHGETPQGVSVRTVFFADPRTAGDDDPVMDVVASLPRRVTPGTPGA
ncbi:MerR family transcriptional regulator [Microbispora corallina]|uniref:MerR family transcriptional regulator n=1 Tax=Microbispora corallina TaxID=83302 RepID=A0ABQ4G9I9_9ACTN|nr:helix-turn-helix domain-containing protein [Microbispora corallina]GIH43751.1 MerR family transcriptional regulator [Microbispora corallina]